MEKIRDENSVSFITIRVLRLLLARNDDHTVLPQCAVVVILDARILWLYLVISNEFFLLHCERERKSACCRDFKVGNKRKERSGIGA